jgi:hypothetical protein
MIMIPIVIQLQQVVVNFERYNLVDKEDLIRATNSSQSDTLHNLPISCKTNRRTGMSVGQVVDEVLYTGLIEMQELPELEE